MPISPGLASGSNSTSRSTSLSGRAVAFQRGAEYRQSPNAMLPADRGQGLGVREQRVSHDPSPKRISRAKTSRAGRAPTGLSRAAGPKKGPPPLIFAPKRRGRAMHSPPPRRIRRDARLRALCRWGFNQVVVKLALPDVGPIAQTGHPLGRRSDMRRRLRALDEAPHLRDRRDGGRGGAGRRAVHRRIHCALRIAALHHRGAGDGASSTRRPSSSRSARRSCSRTSG